MKPRRCQHLANPEQLSVNYRIFQGRSLTMILKLQDKFLF